MSDDDVLERPDVPNRETMVRRGTTQLERWRACIRPPASPELFAREVLYAALSPAALPEPTSIAVLREDTA